MVDSFDGTNDCHEAEMNHIEKLRKEYVQEKYSTNEKTVSFCCYDIRSVSN